MSQAAFLEDQDDLPWPVLVDGLEGDVHRAYGLLPNTVFLIGTDGHVAFREIVAHAPTLRRALDQLLAAGGSGVVLGGNDRVPHMLGATTYGWTAVHRAGPTAVRDMTTTLPPVAASLWLGKKVAPALEPLARRSKQLPRSVRAGAYGILLGLAGLSLYGARKRWMK